MKIAIMSDLHLEFDPKRKPWVPPKLDVDLVILAGDTHPGSLGVIWANEHFEQEVIYICGNHEFYGKRSVNRLPAKLKAKAEELGGKVKVLNNEFIERNGVRFVCATLWTDYNLFGNQPLAILAAQEAMNDFRRITYNVYDRLTPYHLQEEFMVSKNFIFNNITDNTVVITHHAPSELSLGSRQSDIIGAAYASRLENDICMANPKLWIHGHTHHNVDYKIGDTRVITNQRGYNDNGSFKPLIVEI